jgi:hypothetical protein
MTKFYELDRYNLWHIKHNNNGKCSKCGIAFKIGDVIIRKGRGKKEAGRYYHQRCYNALFIKV